MKAIGVNNGNSGHVRQTMADIRDAFEHEAYLERQKVLEALHEEDHKVFLELCEKDPGGAVWYADDNNVPEHGSTRGRIELVRNRIQLVEALRELIGKVDADIFLVTSPAMEQLRLKVETVKEARAGRDRGCLRRIVTGELSS